MGKLRKNHVLQSVFFSFFPPSLLPTEGDIQARRGFVVGKRACDGSLCFGFDPEDLFGPVGTLTCFGVFSRKFVSSCERREF